MPSRALNTHTSFCWALGRAQVPFGSEISCSGPGAGGRLGGGPHVGKALARLRGVWNFLDRSWPEEWPKGLPTGHLLTLAGPRPVREAVF